MPVFIVLYLQSAPADALLEVMHRETNNKQKYLRKNISGASGVRARDGAWQHPGPQPAGGDQAARSRVRHSQLRARVHNHRHARPRCSIQL